ncbi:1-acyl-sn-glycerol-3-phosphate acyltransferase [Mycoplasmatota bacterium]|nr:1-acyl-sn-glycerol-3-phosphate acyltransferase [Mycoplasmatota bacterium]
MNILTEIARFGLKISLHRKYKLKFEYIDFDRKRKEPYILIFNHAQQNDPLFVGLNLKYYPYPIASNIIYTNWINNFGLTKLVKSIPKRKGQADSRTIRMILDTFNKDHRSIMVAPEGNSSFFGEQTPTEFESTAKLAKKLKKDLVIAKIEGGFFANPRWGKLRKRAVIEITFKRLIKSDEYGSYTVEEIAKIMKDAIAFNDYEWINQRDYVYKHKYLAEGIENYLYACPKCEKLQTIYSKNNDIYCKSCGHIAHINQKQYIEGDFDTMIKWNQFQKKVLKTHIDDHFETTGQLYQLDLIKHRRYLRGDYDVRVENDRLTLINEANSFTFDVDKIRGLTLTQKRKITFDYDDDTYMIRMKDSMLIRDLIKMKKGE